MPIRINGMSSSGLDIDKLVSDLMRAERAPLVKKTQNRDLLRLRTDMYREVNTKLMALKDNANAIRFGASFTSVKATSSNENAVKVSGSNPSKVTTSIEVKELASQAMKQGVGKVTKGTGLDLDSSLIANKDKFNTVPDVQAGDLSFEINGVEVQYNADDTIQSIMNKVNQSNAGVVLSYDSAADKFVFIGKQTGTQSKIEVSDNKGSFMSSIGMDGKVETGKDATVIINGVESNRSSNTFTQDGVTYDLLQKTTAPVTIKNTSDTSDLMNKIKDFVKVYNDAIGLVNKLTKEKTVKGYDPLTKEQKKEMNEDEIKEWEKYTKKGLLKNDNTLDSLARELRSFMIAEIPDGSGGTMSLFDIGLSTTKFDNNAKQFSEDAGKIVIDEKKLMKMLEENPQAVESVLTRTDANSNQEGFLHRTYRKLNDTISALNKKAGRIGNSYVDASTELGKQSSKMELDIKMLEQKMLKKEDGYYKKFAAMEKAIVQNNSQLNFLMQNMQ
ncbi:flagellar filament capping protein FliD [Paenibacillus alvei]|uniref:flagellar filament capping protein FliD n=1 Tax=Paenibacillus alvei TaxID=44250 RepID=UPI000385C48A|nr:flagellar filament capping protein FliD [Paenibacillus alvei]EPY09492.1 flagellar hook-associated 2 domain-containing protein [Paenibacillus alvei A6-6i-x]